MDHRKPKPLREDGDHGCGVEIRPLEPVNDLPWDRDRPEYFGTVTLLLLIDQVLVFVSLLQLLPRD